MSYITPYPSPITVHLYEYSDYLKAKRNKTQAQEFATFVANNNQQLEHKWEQVSNQDSVVFYVECKDRFALSGIGNASICRMYLAEYFGN